MCSADDEATQPKAMCSSDAERQETLHKKRKILNEDTSCCGGVFSEGSSNNTTGTESDSAVANVDYRSDLFGCSRASRKLSFRNRRRMCLG